MIEYSILIIGRVRRSISFNDAIVVSGFVLKTLGVIPEDFKITSPELSGDTQVCSEGY